MKHLAAFLALSLASTLALADNSSYYIKGGLSYSVPETQSETNYGVSTWNFDNGLGASLALGKHYSDKLSIELEAQYKKFDADEVTYDSFYRVPLSGDLTYTTAFVNIYYHPQPEIKSKLLNPHIGAGLGVSHVSWNKLSIIGGPVSISASDTVAALQVMLGNRFEITNSWFIDAEYRYFKTQDYNLGDSEKGNFTDSQQDSFVLSVVKDF